MSTRERLQRDRATPEINCWDDMRRFNVSRKGAARSLRAYIAGCPQTLQPVSLDLEAVGYDFVSLNNYRINLFSSGNPLKHDIHGRT